MYVPYPSNPRQWSDGRTGGIKRKASGREWKGGVTIGDGYEKRCVGDSKVRHRPSTTIIGIEKTRYCPIVYAGLSTGGGAGSWIRKKDGRMRLQEKYKVIVVRFEALGLANCPAVDADLCVRDLHIISTCPRYLMRSLHIP